MVEVHEEGVHSFGFPLSLIQAKTVLEDQVLYCHLSDPTAVHGDPPASGDVLPHALCLAGQTGEVQLMENVIPCPSPS